MCVAFNCNPSFVKDVREKGAAPCAIANSTVIPVDPIHFFELGTHCVTTISSALRVTMLAK